MRKVKLKQILLLILRTLLIICIVTAFSRPAIRGYLGGFFGAGHANTTVVLLVDNSASMSRRSGEGSYIDQAKKAVSEISTVIDEGDEAVVIPLASIEKGKVYPPLHTLQDIRKAIADFHVADAPAKMEDGLRIASSVLASSHNINKEIYLISDGQFRNYSFAKPGANDTLQHLRLFDDQTKIFVSDIGAAEKISVRNLSIDSLIPTTTIYEPGRPVEFTLHIHNTGEVPSSETTVLSLFINDERVAQRTINTLPPQKSEKVTISALPRSSGFISVRAELEDDALAFDNKRFVSLWIPIKRHIGIFTAHEVDAQFITLALEQSLSDNKDAPYSVEFHRVEELRMLPSLQAQLDAIFIECGSDKLDLLDIVALKNYITSGRGASMFMLDGIDLQNFNATVSTTLSIPRIESKEGTASGLTAYASISQIDYAHPFFAGMFEEGTGALSARGIESPKIFEYYRVARGGIPLIQLSSGTSFLSQYSLGKGELLLYSIPPSLIYSDFPRKAIFLPLIRRTAAYLSSLASRDENADAQHLTDQAFDLTLPLLSNEQSGRKLILKTPDGSAERIESFTSAGRTRVHIDNATKAGVYHIYKDMETSEPIATFAVNIRTDESDLKQASRDEADSAIAKLSAQPFQSLTHLDISKTNLAETVKQSRFGVELWQSFLLASIVLAIAEMLVAREAKKQAST